MRIESVELIRVRMPLVTPFRTSLGIDTEREVLLVRVQSPDSVGWGECVASDEPRYSSEHTQGAEYALRHFLIPALRSEDEVTASAVQSRVSEFKGHRMAKAALEMAVMDAELRSQGVRFADALGAVHDHVPSGVSVGIMSSIPMLLDTVAGYLSEGYVRIKLKIEPGWDVEPVRAVRQAFGDQLLLQVDANTAYSLADAPHLRRLDDFDLLLIEQPLDEEDIVGHADLARSLRTPICLDESIVSAATAAAAIRLGACSVVNIKAGRVGGYLEARRIHDVCLAHGVAVWCGGMLETGLGRAANVALAALPGFTLPGDVSASARFFATDLTEPFHLRNGGLDVPRGPGVGVEPIPEVLEDITVPGSRISC